MTDIKRRLLACALLMCMMVCVFAGLAAMPAEAADVRATDWMSAVPGSTKLSNMSIPGTHDSCTQNVDMRYISSVRMRASPRSSNMATAISICVWCSKSAPVRRRSCSSTTSPDARSPTPRFQNAHAG